ncbi:TetR/AcrR family transcriptional regulator [Saccharomonospora azurea]|uniref:Transcriptional regulator n=1 Tax=Saccharomonospora azurea NA-128 TaxID=882081 RepID=H8GBG9_9PSEU|nr:TetR/AcrR family transcriptional regulator [Saccharomonospora azurea]EHY87691.1 transcriptional regulator [Saccharomonospora azurea NA-128]
MNPMSSARSTPTDRESASEVAKAAEVVEVVEVVEAVEVVEPVHRRTPGRPRSERASRAIIRAALELLQEGVSVDALSVEAVAARAGVSKATLYRRWPNKEAVLLEALESLVEPQSRVEGGDVRQDVTMVVEELCRWVAESRSARLLPRLMSAPTLYGHYVRLVVDPRIAAVREVLAGGVRRGALADHSDVDTLSTALVGAVLSRVVLGDAAPEAPPGERAARIVDHVLAGHLIEDGASDGRD